MEDSAHPFDFASEGFSTLMSLSFYCADQGWPRSQATLDALLEAFPFSLGISLQDFPLQPARMHQPWLELLTIDRLQEIRRPLIIQYWGTSENPSVYPQVAKSAHIAFAQPFPKYRIDEQEADMLALVTLDRDPLSAQWQPNLTLVLFPAEPKAVRIIQELHSTDTWARETPTESDRLPALSMPFLPELFARTAEQSSEAAVRMVGLFPLFRGVSALQYTVQALHSPHYQILHAVRPERENQARVATGQFARLSENLLVREVLHTEQVQTC